MPDPQAAFQQDPFPFTSTAYVYPVVDPAVGEPDWLSPNPKYSSPAAAGERLGKLLDPPDEKSMCPDVSSAQTPAVEVNSCPSAMIVPGVVPDQPSVAVPDPVAVTCPSRNE